MNSTTSDSIRRPEQIAEATWRCRARRGALRRLFRARRRCAAPAPRASRGSAFASSIRPCRASQSGLSGTYEPQDPDHHAGGGADQHHPAPAVEPVGRDRHQPPGEERDDGNGDEHHRLVDREGAAAHPARHQFGDVGVDGDDLDADADAGDEAPQQHARRTVVWHAMITEAAV